MRRIIVILGVLLAIFIAFDLYPGLRGGAGWQWTYQPSPYPAAVIALATGLMLYVAVSALLINTGRTRMMVAWAVIGGAAIAYLVTGTQGDIGFTLFARTVSPVQTGASALATRIMATEGVLPTLQRWPDVMKQALDANLIHFTTSPPGQPLFHHALGELFNQPALAGLTQPLSMTLRAYQCTDVAVMEASAGEILSAGVGLLFPLFAALAAIPLYFIARDLTGDKTSAAGLSLWVGLLPALSMFAPTWNTLYPVLCLWAFWMLLRGLLTRGWGWFFGAGVVMSITTFLNFSVLPMLLLMGLFTLSYTLWVVDTPARQTGLYALRWPIMVGMIFGAGLVSVWVIFALITGVSVIDILRETFTAHGDLVVREYAPWLVLHVWDIMLFTGLPVALLAIVGAARAGGRHPLTAFSLSMAATVLLVNLAGIVQGENARILIFYMPFLLVMGLSAYPNARPRQTWPLMIAQAAVLWAMASVLYVVPLDMNPQSNEPRTDIGGLGGVAWTPADVTFSSGQYAGQFRLAAHRHIGDPAVQAITFEFLWEGISPTERPYQFELVATTQDPEVGFLQSDPLVWTAQGGAYPPTCWAAGQQINDVVVLRVPVVSAPVIWDVALTARDPRTGDTISTVQFAPVNYP